MTHEEQISQILIPLPVSQVEQYIAVEFSEEEIRCIKEVKSYKKTKMPGRNRSIDPDLATTVIEFVAISVAGGVTYDLLKNAIKKISSHFNIDQEGE